MEDQKTDLAEMRTDWAQAGPAAAGRSTPRERGEKVGVREVLSAAAMTYVARVASSAGYLVFLALTGGRWLLRRPPAAPPAP